MIKASDVKRYEKVNNIEFPHDVCAETGVIGTVINHPEFIFKTEYLKPHMFYERELACIYHVISNLYNKGITEIDSFLITTEIQGNKSFKDIFDNIENIPSIPNYIDELRIVSRDNIEEYELLAQKIVSLSFKIESYIKLNEMAKGILNSNDDINKINYNMQTEIVKFADNYITNNEVQLMGDKIDNIYALIKEERNAGFSGLPSKYEKLNEYFTYERGELVVVGGRAKSGKSMFFLNEAIHKVENGVPVAIFDTEMNDKNWTVRFLAYKSGVDIRKVKSGHDLSVKEEKAVDEAMEWLKNKPLVHIYDPRWTMDKVYMTAKQLKISMGLDFLIYDYIKVASSNEKNPTHMLLGEWTNFLKNDVAGGLNIPVLAGGQLSPKEQRLADSDSINRYASTIAYWIHKTRDEKLNDGAKQGNCKIFIDYNRNGNQFEEGEYLNFVFMGDKARIEQAEEFYHSEDALPY